LDNFCVLPRVITGVQRAVSTIVFDIAHCARVATQLQQDLAIFATCAAVYAHKDAIVCFEYGVSGFNGLFERTCKMCDIFMSSEIRPDGLALCLDIDAIQDYISTISQVHTSPAGS